MTSPRKKIRVSDDPHSSVGSAAIGHEFSVKESNVLNKTPVSGNTH